MEQPSMEPLLGRSGSGGKRGSTAGLLEAIVLIVLMMVSFYHGLHALQPAIHAHPGFTVLFPLFGATALAALLPVLLYLSFRAEFATLHPAYPPHFVFLVRRLLRALSNSKQLKVSAKEL